MSNELWATYSVKDHLNRRALATDIVLYDRLVFPVPETGRFGTQPTDEFPQNIGSPVDRGPVDWEENPIEWSRWEAEKWDPAAQKQLLCLLNPVVRKVPWGSDGPVRDPLNPSPAEATRLAIPEVPDYAFTDTRSILTRDLPKYVTGVSAIGPSYRNVEEAKRDLKLKSGNPLESLPADALATVLAWEFFAPDIHDMDLATDELLKRTVDFVTNDTKFRDHRSEFIQWQQHFIRDDKTDRQSIEKAVAKMRALLEATNKDADRLKVRKTVRNAFRIAPAAVGLGLAVAGAPFAPVTVAAGGVFLSLGAIAVDDFVFKASEHPQPPVAAFVQDARRHFGWK